MSTALPLAAEAATPPPAQPEASPHDRLMDAATQLFCRYGVNSVGVDLIVEAAGVAKTTLYRLFGSKEGLVEKVLEREGQLWRAWFLEEIDGPGGTAPERLQRIGPTLKAWFSRDNFYGCPFINAVGECDKNDDRMRSLAIAHKKVVLQRLGELCAEAGFAEPADTAHTLGIVIDGAIVAALITRDPKIADNATRACAAILAGPRN